KEEAERAVITLIAAGPNPKTVGREGGETLDVTVACRAEQTEIPCLKKTISNKRREKVCACVDEKEMGKDKERETDASVKLSSNRLGAAVKVGLFKKQRWVDKDRMVHLERGRPTETQKIQCFGYRTLNSNACSPPPPEGCDGTDQTLMLRCRLGGGEARCCANTSLLGSETEGDLVSSREPHYTQQEPHSASSLLA
ncbi:hypothetical protein KUCAC02_012873, partial [Chaenocephalus aceratus]